MADFVQILITALAVGSLYALIALGYKQIDAHRVVRESQEKERDIKSAEDLVKIALKRMAATR